MKKIKLYLDYLNGPIWKDIYDVTNDRLITGIEIIDSDMFIQEINEKIQNRYSSFYSFAETGSGCMFNEAAFIKEKEQLSVLWRQLKGRLEEINDGTFEIADYVTEELNI